MKPEILSMIKELGGKIGDIKNDSLLDIFSAITFDTVLYATDEDGYIELYGLSEFFEGNKSLYHADEKVFYEKMLEHFFCLTEKGYGQKFWRGIPFTPFKEGTDDFEEHNDWFVDEYDCEKDEYTHTGAMNLKELGEIVGNPAPDFIWLMFSYGWPDNYYICLSDPNPDNPTVYGTDHEVFFTQITTHGNLEDFLKHFLTKEKYMALAKDEIAGYLKNSK